MTTWTAVAALAAVIQTIVSGIGIFYIRRTLDATTAATEAAINATEQARRAAKVELRAYVSAQRTHSWAVQGDDGATATHNFCIMWENVGSTPARKVISAFTTVLFDGELPEDFVYKKLEDDIGGAIGPRQTVASAPASVNANGMLGKRLYVYGYVEYSDVFAGSPRRRTELCQEVIFSGGPLAFPPNISFRQTGPFNGFDGDCHQSPHTSIALSEDA